MPLLDGIDESLGCIDFLFQEEECVAGILALVFLVGGMFFQQFVELAAQMEFGYIAIVECEVDRTVLFRLYQKVGNDLLEIFADNVS